MKLESHQMSLKTLIANALYGFSVPDFQRNYSWTAAQIDQFWEDLVNLADERFEDHFLGPIVLLQNDAGRKQLIDGQQRITSLILLASILRDSLVENFGDPEDNIEGHRILVSAKLNSLLLLGDYTKPFLQSNYQIRDIFKNYILLHPNFEGRKRFMDRPDVMGKPEKRAAKQLILAHIQITKCYTTWLDAFPKNDEFKIEKIKKLIDSLLSRLQFLSIEVGDEQDAFTIFETLNDRGLKLSPSDLLKSYLLRKVMEQSPQTNREDIIKIWEKISTNLEEYDVSSFLRHYLLTVHNYPVQKKLIFNLIKREVEVENRLDDTFAKKQLDKLQIASHNYAQLLCNSASSLENAEINRRLAMLNMIGDTHRIFLLKIMQLGFTEPELLYAVKACEKFLFRSVICQVNAQVMEGILRVRAHSIEANNVASLKSACDQLVKESPEDELFAASLRSKTTRDTSLQAYAMRSICFGITGNDVTTDKYVVSVEHIAPQKPSNPMWFTKVAPEDSDNDLPMYEDYIYRWGNITILEQKLNASVGNEEWNIKKNGKLKKNGIDRFQGYKDSSIAMIKDLLSMEDWTSQDIDRRTEWFVRQALDYWTKQSLDAPPARLIRFPKS